MHFGPVGGFGGARNLCVQWVVTSGRVFRPAYGDVREILGAGTTFDFCLKGLNPSRSRVEKVDSNLAEAGNLLIKPPPPFSQVIDAARFGISHQGVEERWETANRLHVIVMSATIASAKFSAPPPQGRGGAARHPGHSFQGRPQVDVQADANSHSWVVR